MRLTSVTAALTGALLASTVLTGVAMAQSSPSAQQIINSLTPSGAVSDTTRGIKPLDDSTTPSSQAMVNSLTPSGSVSSTDRGIKPITPDSSTMAPMSTPMASTPTPPAPAQPAPAPSSTGIASTNLDVEFSSGSADLTPQAEATLDQLGKALTSSTLASYNFKIVGHTDTTGDAATNQALSQQRADAVKSYLESKFGVSDTRLQSEGVGESDLLVQTPPNTPELQNRRVQIINLGS